MYDIYGILVIYNQSVLNSPAYLSCKKSKKIKLIVCDNSTTLNNNKSLVEEDGYIYLNMHGNKGLSKAYNAAIDIISCKNGYVILLDDDTSIPLEYFETILHLDRKKDIYIPFVQSKKGLISPAKIYKGIVFKSYNKNFKEKYITGINAGMVIDLNCFKDFRYDEHLFLDYIDHYFLNQMKQKGKKIGILPFLIQQDFSAFDQNLESSFQRFKIFKEDSKFYYRNNRLAYYFVVGKRVVNLMLRFKTIDFIR